ncbi:hypothetical protein H4R34_005026 [Dimargaris verticillata]|uniref:RRM domain-containing protein n=1 Tax=Dimargaris verticillata TaxID=2761393 RepID=A0A9W8AXS6_9FUNG|nr:hypothetical protein H4R34_005026 [Dimargaris verticillata]
MAWTTAAHIGHFDVLPVRMPAAHCQPNPVLHYLYLRAHRDANASKSSHKPSQYPFGRTLFVLNLPADCVEGDLRHLFADCGEIERIVLHGATNHNPLVQLHPADLDARQRDPLTAQMRAKMRFDAPATWYWLIEDPKSTRRPTAEPPVLKSGSYAHVVFAQDAGVQQALAFCAQVTGTTRAQAPAWRPDTATAQEPPRRGLSRYLAAYEHARPRHHDLQMEADQVMSRFKLAEQRRAGLARKQARAADSDGFMTVGSAIARKGVPMVQSVKSMAFSSAQKLPQRQYGKVDFYRFQVREARRKGVDKLQEEFDKAKGRVERFREARKYKPY